MFSQFHKEKGRSINEDDAAFVKAASKVCHKIYFEKYYGVINM